MNLRFGWFYSRSPHSVLLLYLHLQAFLQEEVSMYEPQVLVVLSRSPHSVLLLYLHLQALL